MNNNRRTYIKVLNTSLVMGLGLAMYYSCSTHKEPLMGSEPYSSDSSTHDNHHNTPLWVQGIVTNIPKYKTSDKVAFPTCDAITQQSPAGLNDYLVVTQQNNREIQTFDQVWKVNHNEYLGDNVWVIGNCNN